MNKHVVHIGQNTGAKVLSKQQKQFNNLIKKIDKQRQTLDTIAQEFPRLHQRFESEITPLIRSYQSQRAELVRVFDHAFRSGNFRKRENDKLKHLIIEIGFELIDGHGFDDLKPIYDLYNDQPFDEEKAEMLAENQEMAREMFKNIMGIELDDEELDLENPENMMGAIHEKMQVLEAEAEERARKAEERRAKKPKTEKQLAKEAKKAEEAKNLSKSVKDVYMALVKAFHPDREPDETERNRKTAIMQEVTSAYENNDLLSLLQLQLKFEQIDQDHLDQMSEDRLKYYIKILKEQAMQLEDEIEERQETFRMTIGFQPFIDMNPVTIDYALTADARTLKNLVKDTKSDVAAFKNTDILRSFLKEFKIPKAQQMPNFFDFPDDF